MSSAIKYLAFAILVGVLLEVLIYPVGATSMSFTVQAGQEVTKPLDLAVEDRVTVKFIVTGQISNVLDFYFTDPDGNVIQAYNQTGNVIFSFICSKEGTYVLHFSNVGSSEDKLVSLDYEAQHYILGMPQMLFMTLIILGICLVMIAVFFLMGKPH
ncbi:MAG TPA: emp24/gp25L/p24 family protein [Candidatus Eisenbacteria bacterium]|nr:emp24/gp25L/p24 family protein [Candidatus Eisenbacteria bacterium]